MGLLAVAFKIEPPTHSHGIPISSALLITEKDRSLLKITKSHSIYPRVLMSLFITVNDWFGFQLKGSKV